jgi:hypothetical protein
LHELLINRAGRSKTEYFNNLLSLGRSHRENSHAGITISGKPRTPLGKIP